MIAITDIPSNIHVDDYWLCTEVGGLVNTAMTNWANVQEDTPVTLYDAHSIVQIGDDIYEPARHETWVIASVHVAQSQVQYVLLSRPDRAKGRYCVKYLMVRSDSKQVFSLVKKLATVSQSAPPKDLVAEHMAVAAALRAAS